jgi:hypothetical protein
VAGFFIVREQRVELIQAQRRAGCQQGAFHDFLEVFDVHAGDLSVS